jgi:hypothetical protein
MVLWMDCKPQPVSATAQHSFKVENARHTSLWPQDVTSAAVMVSHGPRAGLQLVRPDGTISHLVSLPALGRVNQGCQTSLRFTEVRKAAGRPAGSEPVMTTISFMAVALPGKVVPSGVTNLTSDITVRVA